MTNEKIEAIREYLQTEFPETTIEQRLDPATREFVFLLKGQGKFHKAIITEEFTRATEAGSMAERLKAFTLAEHLRDLGSTGVRVTKAGLSLEF